MSRLLSLTQCYGVSLKPGLLRALRTDTDTLLDRVTGVSGSEHVREVAREQLGVCFLPYGESEGEDYMLAVIASMRTARDNATLMEVGLLRVMPAWGALLQRVIQQLNLPVSSAPTWFFLAAHR